MKKLKLTEVQRFQLMASFEWMSRVLREIKQHNLEGAALEDMRHLETAVQKTEFILLG